MIKPLPFLTVVLGALTFGVLVSSTASAKVMPVAASVCGLDGCVHVGEGPGELPVELMVPAIDPPRQVPRPAETGEWYSVDLRFGPAAVRQEARSFRDEFPVAFLPGQGLIRTGVVYRPGANGRGGAYAKPGGHWVQLTSAEVAAYEGITADAEPLPADALPPRGGKVSNVLPAATADRAEASTDGNGPGWAVFVAAGAVIALAAAGLAWSSHGRAARGNQASGSTT